MKRNEPRPTHSNRRGHPEFVSQPEVGNAVLGATSPPHNAHKLERYRQLEASDALLDATAVARILGVKKSWVFAASRSGLLPTIKLGRYARYRLEAINEWILEQETTHEQRCGSER